jgi:hypothetical protein
MNLVQVGRKNNLVNQAIKIHIALILEEDLRESNSSLLAFPFLE